MAQFQILLLLFVSFVPAFEAQEIVGLNSTSTFFIETTLVKLCDKSSGTVFETPGNYFQPGITLLLTVVIACAAVFWRRFNKLSGYCKQILWNLDDYDMAIKILAAKIIFASHQPLETQAELLKQLKIIFPSDFYFQLFGNDSDFTRVVDQIIMRWKFGLLKSISRFPAGTTLITSLLKLDITDGFDKGVDIASIASNFFVDQDNKVRVLSDAIDIFFVSKIASETSQTRNTALIFFFLNVSFACYILIDFYSQPKPEGSFVMCQIPYILSVICFKPFTIPMWACLTVACQYSFVDVLFGDNAQCRDVTGTCVSSPIPRNVLSIFLLSVVTLLLGFWFGLAIIFYAYPLIAFSPILIIPAFIVPFFSIFSIMTILGTLNVKVSRFMKKSTDRKMSKRRRSSLVRNSTNVPEPEHHDEEEFTVQNSHQIELTNLTKKQVLLFEEEEVGEDDDQDPEKGYLTVDAMASPNAKKGPEQSMNSPDDVYQTDTAKKAFVFDLSETTLVLKMAATQLLLLIMFALPLVQFYQPGKFSWSDGRAILLNEINFDIPTLAFQFHLNFGWPSFSVPRFTIQFGIGIGLIAVERILLLGHYFLEWLEEKPFFVMHRGEILEQSFSERSISIAFSVISWRPFRSVLDFFRTMLEAAMEHTINEVKQSYDKDGDICESSLVACILGCRMVTCILPVQVGSQNDYCKHFQASATEEEFHQFCNDESALSYRRLLLIEGALYVDVIVLHKLVHLTVLVLDGCSNVVGDIRVFGNLPKLKVLNLSRCKQIFGDVNILSKLTRLRELDIEMCSKLTGDICVLPKSVDLNKLNLAQCDRLTGDVSVLINHRGLLVSDEYENILAEHPCGFKRIQFTGNLRVLAEFKIHELNFAACPNVTGDIGLFVEYPELMERGLGTFDKRNFTGDICELSAVQDKSIEVLNLGGYINLTGDVSVLGNFSKLRELNLADCSELTGDISVLKNFPKLNELNVKKCTKLTGDICVLPNSVDLNKLNCLNCDKLTGDVSVLINHRDLLVSGEYDDRISDADANNGDQNSSTVEVVVEHPCGFKRIQFTGNLRVLAEFKIHELNFAACPNVTGDIGLFVEYPELMERGLGTFDKRNFTGNIGELSAVRDKSIEVLNLGGYINLTGDISVLASFPNLRELNLCGCSELTGDINVLTNFPKLTDLNIEKCSKLTGDICYLPKYVHNMRLSGCYGLRAHLSMLVDNLEWLHAFNIAFGKEVNWIRGNKLEKSLVADDNIEILDLGGYKNFTGDIDVLAKLPKLMDLNLGGCSLLTGDIEVFERLNLHSLRIRNCKQLTGDIAILGQLPYLRVIDLQGCLSLSGDIVLLTRSQRPMLLDFEGCNNLRLEGLTDGKGEEKALSSTNTTDIGNDAGVNGGSSNGVRLPPRPSLHKYGWGSAWSRGGGGWPQFTHTRVEFMPPNFVPPELLQPDEVTEESASEEEEEEDEFVMEASFTLNNPSKKHDSLPKRKGVTFADAFSDDENDKFGRVVDTEPKLVKFAEGGDDRAEDLSSPSSLTVPSIPPSASTTLDSALNIKTRERRRSIDLAPGAALESARHDLMEMLGNAIKEVRTSEVRLKSLQKDTEEAPPHIAAQIQPLMALLDQHKRSLDQSRSEARAVSEAIRDFSENQKDVASDILQQFGRKRVINLDIDDEGKLDELFLIQASNSQTKPGTLKSQTSNRQSQNIQNLLDKMESHRSAEAHGRLKSRSRVDKTFSAMRKAATSSTVTPQRATMRTKMAGNKKREPVKLYRLENPISSVDVKKKAPSAPSKKSPVFKISTPKRADQEFQRSSELTDHEKKILKDKFGVGGGVRL